MTLNKAAHTNLSNEQVAAMARTVMSNTVSLESDPNMKQLRLILAKPLEEFNAAVLRDRSSTFTQLINSLDFQRDKIVVAIRSHCVAAIDQYMIDQTKATQAEVVQKLMRSINANVTQMSYQEESTQIHTLLAGAEQINGAIEESDSAPLFSLLATVQKKFDVQLDAKLKSGEFDDSPRRLKVIRQEITDAVTEIFNYIITVSKFNIAQYGTVITALNAMVDGFETSVQSAKTRAETAEKAAAQTVS